MYSISFERRGEKELLSLPAAARRRVTEAIDALSDEPRPRGCRKIVGEDNVYRIRVGDFRVFYAVFDRELVVAILRVARRDEQTYRYP